MDDRTAVLGPPDGLWVGTEPVNRARPPRRLRGLRFPVLPTGPWLAQVAGGASALVGVYVVAGIGITLIAGGLAAVVLGMLKEAGKI